MKVFIKILKITLGVILGLVFSFVTIVCLEVLLPKPNPFRKEGLNLWLTAPIIAAWVFFMIWLMLRKPSTKKIQTQGIEHLPKSISELIDGIIDAMKYRRGVRADVQQELTDHFTDALADCQGEQQKQERVKELIAEFGDEKVLGKLLRRAKKRCRPLWRTMTARTFQLMGICVVLLIFYIGWFFAGKPVITTNYLEVMNRQVRPVADDSQNAWPFYKQAAEKYVKYESKDGDEKFDTHPTKPSPFTRSKEDKQIIRISIEDNQESLELIRQGNQKPYYWQVYGTGENEDQEMLSVLIPALADYKKLTYLICWQGLLSAEQGDFENAFDACIEAYAFGQHLRGQNTTLIEQLVAIGIEWMSTDTLRMILAKYGEQINAPLLESARKRFEAMVADKDFSINFESEKLFMYDEAQRCFTQSRFGKSHLYLPRLRELDVLEIDKLDIHDKEDLAALIIGGLHVLFTHPDKEQTLREVEQFYSEIEKLSALTPASVKSSGLDMEQYETEVIKNNIFLGVLIPAVRKVVTYSYRCRVDSKSTLVILAVMQYQKQHDELPLSLDILVENGLLKEVPIDPFSDKPIVYRKTDDGFTLYSVGYNLIDDGGVVTGTDREGRPRIWDDEGDAVFWPVESVDGPQ